MDLRCKGQGQGCSVSHPVSTIIGRRCKSRSKLTLKVNYWMLDTAMVYPLDQTNQLKKDEKFGNLSHTQKQ